MEKLTCLKNPMAAENPLNPLENPNAAENLLEKPKMLSKNLKIFPRT